MKPSAATARTARGELLRPCINWPTFNLLSPDICPGVKEERPAASGRTPVCRASN
jgi:hypothetical protein